MDNKQVKFANDLVMSPAYLTAAAEKKQKDDVKSAKKDLHGALTLVLNKVLAPLLLQKCWNFAVGDKPISYAQSAALCFGVACVKSYANFSLTDV